MTQINAARKAIAAALGMLLTVLTLLDKIPLGGHINLIVGIVLAVLTPVVTWLVPNKAKATA